MPPETEWDYWSNMVGKKSHLCQSQRLVLKKIIKRLRGPVTCSKLVNNQNQHHNVNLLYLWWSYRGITPTPHHSWWSIYSSEQENKTEENREWNPKRPFRTTPTIQVIEQSDPTGSKHWQQCLEQTARVSFQEGGLTVVPIIIISLALHLISKYDYYDTSKHIWKRGNKCPHRQRHDLPRSGFGSKTYWILSTSSRCWVFYLPLQIC